MGYAAPSNFGPGSLGMRPLLLASLVALVACEGNKPDANKFITAASCDDDKGCAEGFICQEGKCQKGQRSPEEIAAAKKAELEAKQKALAARRETKPGEGRLSVRICPFFKNTMESIGTIKAIHQETGKIHYLDMAMEADELGYQDVFTFYSLPLGKYDVEASYGIQVKGVPETHPLKCDEKIRKKCRNEMIREVEVVLPENEPPVEKDKEGKPIKQACDFSAE